MIQNLNRTVPEIEGHFTIFNLLVEVTVCHGVQAYVSQDTGIG
jgi:hypothetical protein